MGYRNSNNKVDPATEQFQRAVEIVKKHPMFTYLIKYAYIVRKDNELYPKNGYACVDPQGTIYAHPKRYAEAEVWVYILAHCLLHLGFGHFKIHSNQNLWNIACDVFIAKFLDDFKFGKNPSEPAYILRDTNVRTEEDLYKYFLENGANNTLLEFGIGNPGEPDMILCKEYSFKSKEWQERFSRGLQKAVSKAVNIAAGIQASLSSSSYINSSAQRAREWFMNSYPLLGSLAASFEIIENRELCKRMDISVAAVHAEMREIYINPDARLTEEECKFVIAHELLHVGLRHDTRRQGRDAFLWNVACDYVINNWLVEMEVGRMPTIGVLYDSKLKEESAEAIYDIITSDLRKMRKVTSFRGIGKGDILEPQIPDWWSHAEGVDLDSFYRSRLMQGLEYHFASSRGLLPAGLIEEVKALSQPPIPWDTKLAEWFDEHFPPVEKIRTYTRLSRRQSGSPDIPRPKYCSNLEIQITRTYGVVLDTSASMDRSLLAKMLGAIVSYSLSRDVYLVRLVFCDAAAYDQGFVSPEALCERIEVKGRGGTMLQTGIDLLEKATDFPKDGPILIITDGGCDKLIIKREHAFLIPAYARLPFVPGGEVFRVM